jgi:hypothetical protein
MQFVEIVFGRHEDDRTALGKCPYPFPPSRNGNPELPYEQGFADAAVPGNERHGLVGDHVANNPAPLGNRLARKRCSANEGEVGDTRHVGGPMFAAVRSPGRFDFGISRRNSDCSSTARLPYSGEERSLDASLEVRASPWSAAVASRHCERRLYQRVGVERNALGKLASANEAAQPERLAVEGRRLLALRRVVDHSHRAVDRRCAVR